MRTLAGPDAHIHFTSLSAPSQRALMASISTFSAPTDLARVSYHTTGVLDLLSADSPSDTQNPSHLHANKICLLDPKSDTPLSPADGDGRFHTFLFGVRPVSDPDSPCSPPHSPPLLFDDQGILGAPSTHLPAKNGLNHS